MIKVPFSPQEGIKCPVQPTAISICHKQLIIYKAEVTAKSLDKTMSVQHNSDGGY